MDCLSHMWGVYHLGLERGKLLQPKFIGQLVFQVNKKKQKIQTKTNNQLKPHQPSHVLNQKTGICSSNLFNLNSLINPFIWICQRNKERKEAMNQASKQASTTTTLLVGSSHGRSFCQSLFSQHFHHSCCCFYSFLFLKFPCLKKHTDWLSHTFFVFFLILGHQEAQDSLRWGRGVGWWMDCPCPCPVCVFLSKPGSVWMIYQKLYNNNSGEWNELHTCRVLARDLFCQV